MQGRRLLPFLCLLYIFNILDRSNVGFARLTMQKALGMAPDAFDLCFGIFYFGYLVFEVPANLLLRATATWSRASPGHGRRRCTR